jgi:CDP-4-dehydro-6-deoxyglucose reductase
MRARLVDFREIAPDVRHFVFDVPDAEKVAFVPGQWYSVTADIQGEPVTRAYSIASPPDGNQFALCLNRVPEGLFSPHLFDLRLGDDIDIKGPYGSFIFRRPVSDSILVATGTGIAPFRSMLQARLPVDGKHEFTLIFGVRHEYGLLYRDEFEAMALTYPNFNFRPTLTQPPDGWTGRTGRVQAHVLEAVGDRRDIDVYICGLKAMVYDVRNKLRDLGFDRKQIIYEKYD